jgi:hypothetical protein
VSLTTILTEVVEEIGRARAKHGTQTDIPDGNRFAGLTAWDEADARHACQEAFAEGRGTWAHILVEEVAEALEEATTGPSSRLREELLQVACVAVSWVDAIDERSTT